MPYVICWSQQSRVIQEDRCQRHRPTDPTRSIGTCGGLQPLVLAPLKLSPQCLSDQLVPVSLLLPCYPSMHETSPAAHHAHPVISGRNRTELPRQALSDDEDCLQNVCKAHASMILPLQDALHCNWDRALRGREQVEGIHGRPSDACTELFTFGILPGS